MPSTDIDGSAILILSAKEAYFVKMLLTQEFGHDPHNETAARIMTKVKDVETYESRRLNIAPEPYATL